VSAARAVLRSGEYDYAWNMQVEDEILLKLEAVGKGRINITPSGNVEFMQLNSTDPAVDGERASITVHSIATKAHSSSHGRSRAPCRT
jgi:peptide/nickel transport system substrate-binding protein